jgi:hypothetical protein
MEPNYMVVQTMLGLIWLIVGVLVIVALGFMIGALVNLNGILRSVNKMVKDVEKKSSLVNKIIDDAFGFVSAKITSLLHREKENKETD